jgi:primosomal protein N'
LPEVKIVCPDILLKNGEDKLNESMPVDGQELPVSLISTTLRDEITTTLASGRQAVLFLNLRGFARSIICSKCGWVARCPGCEISLAYHRTSRSNICHHCGHQEPALMACGRCGHSDMRFLGWGTERLETEIRALFPSARIARMDRDTVVTRGRRRTIVDGMRKGEVDILLGTQMVAKGLDFPAVRLVGVISADQSLHIPDFRASERTFQLITQVIGRAGRSDDIEREGGGIAVIQSFDPGNRVLQTACSQDFESFYEEEIKLRYRFGYPPAMHLARIVLSGANKDEVFHIAEELGKVLEKHNPSNKDETLQVAGELGKVLEKPYPSHKDETFQVAGEPGKILQKHNPSNNASGELAKVLEKHNPANDAVLLGPAPAPLEKLEGRWRVHFILKARKTSLLVNWILAARREYRIKSKLRLEIDIDPMSML